MKFIILVEGSNDRVFLSEILKRTAAPNIFPLFYPNKGTKSVKKDKETVLLRSFCGNAKSHNLIVKEEGGHDFVIDLFVNLVVNFLMNHDDIYLTVLFDHDGRTPEAEIDKINNDLKAKTSKKIEFKLISPKSRIIEGLYRRDFSLCQHNGDNIREVTKFSFVSFDMSLEYAVSKFCKKSKKGINQNDVIAFASSIKFNDLISNPTPFP